MHLDAIPWGTIWLAAVSTFFGYAALVGYEWSALRYIGKSIPTPLLVAGSMTAYAMSNTVGMAVLTGGVVRHRIYHGLKLDIADIALISSFCALFFGLGVTVIGLVALMVQPAALSQVIPIDVTVVRTIACVALVLILLLVFWLSRSRKALTVGRFRLAMPELNILAAQLLFTAQDISLTGFTLYLLLPDSVAVPYAYFMAVFATAAFVSVLSHVPGGIGVFDGIVIMGVAAMPEQIPGVAAALLAFRVIYYLIPFLLSIGLLVGVTPFLRSIHNNR